MYKAMDEIWDIYDENRNKTGRLHKRGKPMNAGDYHLVVQVWITNSEGKYLISRQASDDGNGKWMTTGGCAIAGEDGLSAALRETKEELGIVLDPKKGLLFKQDSFKHTHDEGSAFFDVWLFRQEADISAVVFQPGETCDAVWASKEMIRRLIDEDYFMKEWYPYLDELFCIKSNPSAILAEPANLTCTCPDTACEWHGNCKSCIALHRYYATVGDCRIPNCLKFYLDRG